MAKPKHDFKLWRSRDNKIYWVYYDGNYEALVTSEMYNTAGAAREGLKNFLEEMKQYLG